jgi:hypothetical protein
VLSLHASRPFNIKVAFCPLRSPVHHAGPSHLTNVRLLTNNQEKKKNFETREIENRK